ncbi:MAG: hypothetical protein MK165_08615 [Pirellulaceae bacterium]|nr:hypothetical protein [Pirellulaceae bacterium]
MTPQETDSQTNSDVSPPPSTSSIDPTKIHHIADHKHERPLTTCRVDPSGKFAFAGAEDLNVYRWDLESGEKTVLAGHQSWVRSMDFSPDGQWLYTAGWEGQIRSWEVAAESPVTLNVIQAHRGCARWVQSSPCGQMLTTCGNDKRIRVWDAASGKQIVELSGHRRHPYAVLFHPTDGHLVSEDLMGIIRVWDPQQLIETNLIDASVMTGYDNKFAADMGGARDMCFSSDGSTLACAGITAVVNSFAGEQDPIVVLVDWQSKAVTHYLKQTERKAGIMWGVRCHPAGFVVGAVALQGGGGQLLFWQPAASHATNAPVNESDQTAGDQQAQTAPELAGEPIELKPYHTFALPNCARGMDFTSDARRVVIAHANGNLGVYEMAEKTDDGAAEPTAS